MTLNQRPPARQRVEDPSGGPRVGSYATPAILPGTGIRVLVASEYPLITEAVGTALEAYGFAVWPVPGELVSAPVPPEAEGVVDVGLVMYDLSAVPRRRVVEVLVRRLPMRWLLLTGTPSGPLWGAMLEGGVAAILPTSAPRDRVVMALRELATGGEVIDAVTRADLLRQWQTARAERDLLMARISTLTARERSVLNLLYLGESVRTISQLSGVSETTVRSQVRSLLHKLGVNSQLAAVALWAAAREDLDER